ncbi:MAG TPA: hypothetical protein VMS00_10485, partial [Acidimicrobiales bacterium]|nr:hypothetical protein [Acidimicrobiales bacterium]
MARRARPFGRKSNPHGQLLLAVAQVVVVLALLLPMIWLYMGSFRTDLDLDNGSFLPHSFTLGNFGSVFAQGFW